MKKILGLLFSLLTLSFSTSTARAQEVNQSDETQVLIEGVKQMEKRFQLALTATHRQDYESQKKLLKDSFDLFARAVNRAKALPSRPLIVATVKLGNMLIDNDMSENTADQIYLLYRIEKTHTAFAIEQLDAVSAKKIKEALKMRKKVRDKLALKDKPDGDSP